MGGKTKKRHPSQTIAAPNLSLQPDLETEDLGTDQTELLTFFFVTALSQAIYYLTMYPSMAPGDSGELMTVAVEFGAAHAPGYPLITILGYVFNKLMPWGTPAWKLNTLSTLFGGLSTGLIYLTIKQVTYNNLAAVLTALWCAFSRLHWTWNLHFEVFSLNNMLAVAILLSMVKFSKEHSVTGMIRGAKVCAAMCGLAMSNQHTSILIIAPGAVWVLATLLQNKVTEMKVLVEISLYGLSGLFLYLQLPLSALIGNARLHLKDQSSFTNSLLTLKRHFLREDYGSFRLSATDVPASFAFNLHHWVTLSTSDLTPAIWALAGLTPLLSYKCFNKPARSIIHLFSAMLIVYMVVFGNMANLTRLAVLERFWLLPNILLICIAGIGLGELFNKVQEKLGTDSKQSILWTISATLVTTLLVLWQIQRNYARLDQSNNNSYKNYADHLLRNAPINSIVIVEGDQHIGTAWYHTYGEERRTDLCPIAPWYLKNQQEFPWFFGWLDKMCPGVVTEGQGKGWSWAKFLDDNYDSHTILSCGNIANEVEGQAPGYKIWPWGLCYIVIRAEDNKDYYEYFLNEIPKIDEFLGKTKFLSQTKYTLYTFIWENLFSRDSVISIEQTASLLHSYAAGHTDPVKQREMMMSSREYLETAIHYLYLYSGHDDFTPGKRDLRNILYKTLGYNCVILYILTTDDASKAELEQCARKNLRMFIGHEEQVDPAKEDFPYDEAEFIKQAKAWLSFENFSSLYATHE